MSPFGCVPSRIRKGVEAEGSASYRWPPLDTCLLLLEPQGDLLAPRRPFITQGLLVRTITGPLCCSSINKSQNRPSWVRARRPLGIQSNKAPVHHFDSSRRLPQDTIKRHPPSSALLLPGYTQSGIPGPSLPPPHCCDTQISRPRPIPGYAGVWVPRVLRHLPRLTRRAPRTGRQQRLRESRGHIEQPAARRPDVLGALENRPSPSPSHSFSPVPHKSSPWRSPKDNVQPPTASSGRIKRSSLPLHRPARAWRTGGRARRAATPPSKPSRSATRGLGRKLVSAVNGRTIGATCESGNRAPPCRRGSKRLALPRLSRRPPPRRHPMCRLSRHR